jgi:hypothetical protein
MQPATLESAAERLAVLLTAGGTTLADPTSNDLEFAPDIAPRPLAPAADAPAEVWAVDGGQATVADARCVSLLVTRAARVCFRTGTCVLEDDGEMHAWLLGLPTPAGDVASVDANYLRDRAEWETVARCIDDAASGALLLVDGDLQPDWRIPSSFLADALAHAAERDVTLVGVTKRSSLSRGGAPLLGQLELEAERAFGPRARWWTPVARTRPDIALERGHRGLQIVAARLDPDAPFAFRIDLPATVDAAEVLGALAVVSDDAGFPGYPYPLTVADRLASCPGWLRAELRLQLDDHFDRYGVPLDVRERAFADRHDRMERQ